MASIDVEFEVYKALTVLRQSESDTYNDVIRRLLPAGKDILKSASPKITGSPVPPPGSASGITSTDAWHTKGVIFPPGTEFRASHRGKPYFGRVESGALVVNGKRYHSPSAAAVAITGNSVNGWIFWECKRAGSDHWQSIKASRRGF